MFKHLLVPIDGSTLSDRLIGRAIDAAKRANSILTFFHASADYAATSDGALAHAAWPAEFELQSNAEALRILAKAEAAARAVGVTCHTAVRTGDRPHEAIHEAAIEFKCDAIIIATRGGGAITRLFHRSVTSRLLNISKLPVIVTAISNDRELSDEEAAVAILREEHRSLAAVLHAMKDVIAQAALTGHAIDIRLLRAMLYYIETFPEQLHHPKEEAYVFSKLRERAPEFRSLLDKLQQEHDSGGGHLRVMSEALVSLEKDPQGGLPEFAKAAEQFIADQLRHMSLEETSLMPAARIHFTSQDWREIKEAFQNNADPRFGTDADEPFDHLLGRLMSLAHGQLGASKMF